MPDPFGPIRPDAVAARDRRAEIANDGALTVREAHSARFDDEPARSLSFLRLKPNRARALASGTALAAQRLQRANASLVARSPRLDARPNPDFLLRQLLVELRPLARLGGQRRFLANEIRVVIGAPVHEPAAIELDDPRREAAQKRAIVRDEHQRCRAVDEETLHPFDRVDVEMVRRLVEQQHVGLTHERAGEQRLALSPARRRGERHVGVEAEVRQHRLDARLQLPRVCRIERVMQPIELTKRSVARLHGDAMAGLMILREQQPRRAETRGDNVVRRAVDVAWYLLLESRDGDPCLTNDVAGIRHDRPVEEFHDRALSRAVPSEETDAFASFDRERRPVEERRPTERDADILHCQKCH